MFNTTPFPPLKDGMGNFVSFELCLLCGEGLAGESCADGPYWLVGDDHAVQLGLGHALEVLGQLDPYPRGRQEVHDKLRRVFYSKLRRVFSR